VVGLPPGSGDIIHKRSRGFLYRATCNRMDAVCVHLYMPSIVSRLKTSLPSVHNEPITCTINGWHTGTYSIPA
jgi:hypothetical protein